MLAADVHADVDIPGFTDAVMDGYAVHAADTTGAGDSVPSMLTLPGRTWSGQVRNRPVNSGECIYIPTGGILARRAPTRS